MPPCAQTECERFTGTTEKSSTECPASAIFIAAASPASPPPTIATRIPLFAMSVENPSEQSARSNECDLGVDADRQKHEANCDAGVAGHALRALADDDAPVNGEEPQPVRQVPHGRRDADEIDDEDDDATELAAHDFISQIRILGDREIVESRNQAEAEVEHVKRDEEEEDYPRDALDCIEPVARIRVREVVGSRLPCDEQPVNRVINQRKKDAQHFDEQDVGNRL